MDRGSPDSMAILRPRSLRKSMDLGPTDRTQSPGVKLHSVAAVLDPRVCATLHVFHAFTGCDTTSFVLILQYTCIDFRGTEGMQFWALK